jgi:sterol desaturase/sphingolipid hydroxylase (fatty acid hydroxylase superfamily)
MREAPLLAGPFRHFLPALILIALIEVTVLAWQRPERVDWKESLATLGVALGHTGVNLITRSFAGGAMLLLWPYRLLTIPVNTPLGLAGLLLCSEFFYYWEHRFSHTMRWAWASHSVHHSPVHLNFSAAYRLGWTGILSAVPLVFVPMVLLGFSPAAVGAMLAVNLLYQFWLHNEWMPKLGPLEWILNTPSSHRVHHASNAHYLDQNYGGMLIIFDHLFGTYSAEREACVYGLTHGINSYNPLRIALGEWGVLCQDVKQAPTFKQKFVTLFGPPASSGDANTAVSMSIEGYDAALHTAGPL